LLEPEWSSASEARREKAEEKDVGVMETEPTPLRRERELGVKLELFEAERLTRLLKEDAGRPEAVTARTVMVKGALRIWVVGMGSMMK
jgi:hypothetical protein